MDFFGILFDMKNGKKVPYSKTYFDTLFAESLAGVTTITGTLPLTFTTSETALRSWTIYGNNTPHNYSAEGTLPLTFTTHTAGAADNWTLEGNNNIGKNIFEIIPSDQIITETGTLTFVTDAESGTITANGTTGSTESNVKQRFIVTSELAGDYYFSGSFNQTGSLSTFDAYMYDQTVKSFIKKWDGTTTSPTIKDTKSQEVKLIEGHTVELTFRVFKNASVDNVVFKPMLRPADTSPDFEPYQIGVGQRTANIFTETGSEMVQVTSNGDIRFGKSLGKLPGGQYTINADNKSGRNVFLTYRTGDSYKGSNALNTFPVTVTVPDNVDEVFFRTVSSDLTTWSDYGYSKIVIVAGNTAPESFIPYGYEIPLTVSQDGQTDKTVDIFIGENPLTEGETVSKQSTGVDLELFEGENTVSTTLYNKPSMSIEGVDYVGVGILTANLFIIALKLQAGGQTLNVFNITLNKPLRAGETLTSEQTGQTINTVAGVENKLSPSPKAAAYGGNFEMTIKFKE